jgi:hypothetical protein
MRVESCGLRVQRKSPNPQLSTRNAQRATQIAGFALVDTDFSRWVKMSFLEGSAPALPKNSAYQEMRPPEFFAE